MRGSLQALAATLAAFVMLPVAESTIKLHCNVNAVDVDLIDGEAFPSRVDGTKFDNTCAGSTRSQTFVITNEDASNSVIVSQSNTQIAWYDNSDTRTISDVLGTDFFDSGDVTIPASGTANLVISVLTTASTADNNWAYIDLYDDSNNALFGFGITAKVVVPEIHCENPDSSPRPLNTLYPLDFGVFAAGTTSSHEMEFGCKLISDCSVQVNDISMTTSQRLNFDGTVQDSSFAGLTVDGWSGATTYTFDSSGSPISYYDVKLTPSNDGQYEGEVTVAVAGGFDYTFPVSADVGLPTSSPTSSPTQSTFDWGADCASGTGTFNKNIPVKDAYERIGTEDIPIGKFDVVIRLTSSADLDIWLYDTTDTSYGQGLGIPLVRWCNPRKRSQDKANDCTADNSCLCASSYGHLGQSETDDETLVYETELGTMNITYSGYDGGSEYICISGGMTKVPLAMYAYAYEVGDVTVDYEWKASCLGTPFTAYLSEDEVSPVGDVASSNVWDLTVALTPVCASGTSEADCKDQDLDIQLYDKSQTYEDGSDLAIVAWCTPRNDCNYGNVTSGTRVTGTWDGTLPIEYSGWNGIDGYKGREYISIPGAEVDRALAIKTFGYKDGTATVRYWWTSAAVVSSCPA